MYVYVIQIIVGKQLLIDFESKTMRWTPPATGRADADMYVSLRTSVWARFGLNDQDTAEYALKDDNGCEIDCAEDFRVVWETLLNDPDSATYKLTVQIKGLKRKRRRLNKE